MAEGYTLGGRASSCVKTHLYVPLKAMVTHGHLVCAVLCNMLLLTCCVRMACVVCLYAFGCARDLYKKLSVSSVYVKRENSKICSEAEQSHLFSDVVFLLGLHLYRQAI